MNSLRVKLHMQCSLLLVDEMPLNRRMHLGLHNCELQRRDSTLSTHFSYESLISAC